MSPVAGAQSVAARPTASVIVPFAGSQEKVTALITGLLSLERAPGDELIVVDNRPQAPPAPPDLEDVRWCAASALRSPSFARNAGAGLAQGEWLVFIDADTRPARDLLGAYLIPPVAPTTGVLAGSIVELGEANTIASRYGAARTKMHQTITLARDGRPYAQTANCAIRRSAFEQVGGFTEGIMAGEDADLCFRLAGAGWEIEQRAHASVEHRSRETLRALLAQLARHGSGAAWLNRRYPGEFPRPSRRERLRRPPHYLLAATRALRARDPEAAMFALIDLAALWAFDLGRRLSNQARR